MTDDERWTKAERLAVAGALAPHLRDQGGRSTRRVALTDKDGNVTGYTTLAEVQKSLLRAREIELDVQDGVRPKVVLCQNCGKDVPVLTPGGSLPKVCNRKGGCHGQRKCCRRGCQSEPPVSAFKASAVKARQGQPWTCHKCRASETMAAMRKDPQLRKKNAAACNTPRHRARKSKIRRRLNADPAYRARISEGKRKQYARDPEAKARQAKICAAMRATLAAKPKRIATCHPERPYRAKGLCGACYQRLNKSSPSVSDAGPVKP